MSIIDDLELSVRASNVLRRRGRVETLDDFMILTKDDIMAQPNAGARTWREIEQMHKFLRARNEAPPPLSAANMTLRDAAALAALPAIISATSQGLHQPGQRGVLSIKSVEDRIAADAYRIADAFIAARETKEDDR